MGEKRSFPALSSAERLQVSKQLRSAALEAPWGRQLGILREAERFERCGSSWVRMYHCPECSHAYRFNSSCNSRICPRCGRREYHRLKGRFLEAIRPLYSYQKKSYGGKFLTLTWPASRFKSGFPDRVEFKRCQAEVRRMLRWYYHKFHWRQSPRSGKIYEDRKRYRGCGAVGVFEYGANGVLHYHAFTYGPFIAQAVLSKAWKKITGDAEIVWIEAARSPREVVEYILKYLTKPPLPAVQDLRDPEGSEISRLVDWALLLKGHRRLASYGVLYNAVKTGKKKSADGIFCLFDGSRLEYSGEVEDPKNCLLDYWTLIKYVDKEARAWLRDHAHPYGRDRDKSFYLIGKGDP